MAHAVDDTIHETNLDRVNLFKQLIPGARGKDWVEVTKLLASDGMANDFFGSAVSLSDDGTVALVGAPGKDEYALSGGGAYIFKRDDGAWSQQTMLECTDRATYGYFGYAVSLSGDGTVALIGAIGVCSKGTNSGAAYIFVEADGVWTQQCELLADDGRAYDSLGITVSLSDDGTVALVGANGRGNSEEYSGATYEFTVKDSVWVQVSKVNVSDVRINDDLGTAVSLSKDDTIALVASVTDATNGITAGAAYIFVVTTNT